MGFRAVGVGQIPSTAFGGPPPRSGGETAARTPGLLPGTGRGTTRSVVEGSWRYHHP